MNTRQLGNSDLKVSTIGFGCWAIVGGFNWGPQDEADSIAALRTAYDCGCTFFDTAEAYGDGYSEELIAKALDGERDTLVIASKASPSHFRAKDLRKACENSLRRLKTDYIDLYQLHWPTADVPLDETLATLAALRKEGKIREAGVSNFGVKTLEQCTASSTRIVSNQMAYNLLFRAIEFDILPYCVEHAVSVVCYSPILQGLLAGKFRTPEDVPEDRARTRHFSGDRPQARHGEDGAEKETFAAIGSLRQIAATHDISMANMALAWLLAQDGVASAITGARNAQQAKRNAAAGDIELSPDIVAELNLATDPLKQRLGANPDMWQGDSRVM